MNALVVGGSSGVGLALVLQLVQEARFGTVYVLDKAAFPEAYADAKVRWLPCDLSLGDYAVLEGLEDVRALYITAGFGHLNWFQDLSPAYIDASFAVNAVAPVRIIRHFYDRLLSGEAFDCGVMVSIAGRLASPLFSVYSATKAALNKFIEAVNVELEVQGSENRILEVSPGSLKGTSFNGGAFQPELVAPLAREIIDRSRKHETLYIPQYEEVFKGVLERYHDDPHQFGLDSYLHKKSQGRF